MRIERCGFGAYHLSALRLYCQTRNRQWVHPPRMSPNTKTDGPAGGRDGNSCHAARTSASAWWMSSWTHSSQDLLPPPQGGAKGRSASERSMRLPKPRGLIHGTPGAATSTTIATPPPRQVGGAARAAHELVCLLVPGQADRREVTQDCKGTSPSDTHGRALPQFKETLVSAHWLTVHI